jgi:hypothetical protein
MLTASQGLASGLRRSASGRAALTVDDLEPLWDYYVEAPSGRRGAALAGTATRHADGPQRRTRLTGPIAHGAWNSISAAWSMRSSISRCVSMWLRRTASSARRRPRYCRAHCEERRALDPDAHTHRTISSASSGIVAGVTAVDAEGQKIDSDIHYFVVLTVAVEVADIDPRRRPVAWRRARREPGRRARPKRRLDAGARSARRERVSRGDYGASRLEANDAGAQHPNGTPQRELGGSPARRWRSPVGPWRRGADCNRLGPPVPNPFNLSGS